MIAISPRLKTIIDGSVELDCRFDVTWLEGQGNWREGGPFVMEEFNAPKFANIFEFYPGGKGRKKGQDSIEEGKESGETNPSLATGEEYAAPATGKAPKAHCTREEAASNPDSVAGLKPKESLCVDSSTEIWRKINEILSEANESRGGKSGDRGEKSEETCFLDGITRHRPKKYRRGWFFKWVDRFVERGMNLFYDLVCSGRGRRSSFLKNFYSVVHEKIWRAEREVLRKAMKEITG